MDCKPRWGWHHHNTGGPVGKNTSLHRLSNQLLHELLWFECEVKLWHHDWPAIALHRGHKIQTKLGVVRIAALRAHLPA
ncbi:hypothetical protein [Denitromonas ohlonensis]|uniref:hypothetical protein n=1 Tax=Denitromonas ohlonensis TaxID=3078508 RepID=UPI001642B345|nr:hypothetical protein [Denitromonas ohlonensis]